MAMASQSRPDDALAILRRLEPVLQGISEEQKRQGAEIKDVRDEIKDVRDEIKGVRDEIKDVRDEIKDVRIDIRDVQKEQKQQSGSIAEVKGRLMGLEKILGYVPTLWQIVTAMVAINAAIVALAFSLVHVILIAP